MIGGLGKEKIKKYIILALEEDVSSEDITTNSVIDSKSEGQADLICKENGVLAGIEVFEEVFNILGEVKVEKYYNEVKSIISA